MIDQSRTLITGANGLMGQHLLKILPNAIAISHKDFDLTCENEVKYMFYLYQPQTVIHLAARVGSVQDNIQHQAFYFDDNILMNTFMVKYSYINNVERFIGVLSSYVFPENKSVSPTVEDDLHCGPPALNNFSYSYTKRALAVQIDSYNNQFGTKYNYVTPCNLFGEGEKKDLTKSHFIIALLLKIKEAVKNNSDHIVLFGDGTPKRQFLYSGDFAAILKNILEQNIYDSFNIAPDESYSVEQVAKIALKATNNEYLKIIYDKNKPNGQQIQLINSNKFKSLMPGFKFTSIEDGIIKIYNKI